MSKRNKLSGIISELIHDIKRFVYYALVHLDAKFILATVLRESAL
jgi:hypothetical protein